MFFERDMSISIAGDYTIARAVKCCYDVSKILRSASILLKPCEPTHGRRCAALHL